MSLKSQHKIKKLIALVGPTAVGKSAWAIELAKTIGGVVISADSRQIYKGLDLLTAKTSKADMQGIRHYMIDIINVEDGFSVNDYQQQVYKLIDKLPPSVTPILVGGTGLYISAVCDGYNFLNTKPNPKLRHTLENLDLGELQKRLLTIDPNTSVDISNPRRVIRALEILESGAKMNKSKTPRYECLKIGILRSPDEIRENITMRVRAMDLDKLLLEAKALTLKSVPLTNPLSTYFRPALDLISGKITKEEAINRMIRADIAYSKRQMTWFKKDRDTYWVKELSEAQEAVSRFLKSTAPRP